MSIKQEILDLIEYKKFDLADYNDVYELYNDLEYDGSLHEIIDGSIDIYNYDLRKWAVDNYDYVDQAQDAGLTADDSDYHSRIQTGQYVYYSELANEALEEIFNEFEPEDDNEEVA
jgi:hypothetical protein